MARRKPEYKVNSFLIADDLRRESSGKDIIIGVYGHNIVGKNAPQLLPSFVVRFDVTPYSKEYKSIMKILDPDDILIAEINSNLTVETTGISSPFHYRLSPLVLEKPGTYKILLGLNKKPVEVGRFDFIVDNKEEEKQIAN